MDITNAALYLEATLNIPTAVATCRDPDTGPDTPQHEVNNEDKSDIGTVHCDVNSDKGSKESETEHWKIVRDKGMSTQWQ